MYYHPDFNGSFSIKSVLPAMFPDDAALDYKGLDIQAGDMASMIYADLDRIDDESERRKIRQSLLEYCKLDTLAMVMIWRQLSGIADKS
jgi:nucleoside diphosphate kinase